MIAQCETDMMDRPAPACLHAVVTARVLRPKHPGRHLGAPLGATKDIAVTLLAGRSAGADQVRPAAECQPSRCVPRRSASRAGAPRGSVAAMTCHRKRPRLTGQHPELALPGPAADLQPEARLAHPALAGQQSPASHSLSQLVERVLELGQELLTAGEGGAIEIGGRLRVAVPPGARSGAWCSATLLVPLVSLLRSSTRRPAGC